MLVVCSRQPRTETEDVCTIIHCDIASSITRLWRTVFVLLLPSLLIRQRTAVLSYVHCSLWQLLYVVFLFASFCVQMCVWNYDICVCHYLAQGGYVFVLSVCTQDNLKIMKLCRTLVHIAYLFSCLKTSMYQLNSNSLINFKSKNITRIFCAWSKT